MDIFTPQQRHNVMSRIKSRDTGPEKAIRRTLHRAGFRYRVAPKSYPGKPDLVLPKYYAVVFINGCFWHAHRDCPLFRMPASNVEFWKEKFRRNTERDRENLRKYQDKCWRVCIVWECSIRGRQSRRKIEEVTGRIIQWLENPGDPVLEI